MIAKVVEELCCVPVKIRRNNPGMIAKVVEEPLPLTPSPEGRGESQIVVGLFSSGLVCSDNGPEIKTLLPL